MYDLSTLAKLNAVKESNTKALNALYAPKSVFGDKSQPKFQPTQK